ncbi:MAG: hypothetical protein V7L20_17790 [Nostoc sp.]|uniref:hypothetical protein n=1 Tax=Nostoc sp. TaxID=1180 RepID=UPI002FF4F1DF
MFNDRITEAITTLQDAENRFGFVHVEDEKFFPEWYEGLSEITEADKVSVDVVRRRYLYHRAGGDLLEVAATQDFTHLRGFRPLNILLSGRQDILLENRCNIAGREG